MLRIKKVMNDVQNSYSGSQQKVKTQQMVIGVLNPEFTGKDTKPTQSDFLNLISIRTLILEIRNLIDYAKNMKSKVALAPPGVLMSHFSEREISKGISNVVMKSKT
jgi:hypothetical protein